MAGIRGSDQARNQVSHEAPRTAYLPVHENNKPTGNPWGVFELASKYDFPLLATHTVPDLIFSHLWASAADEVRPWDMDNVSGKYATALLRAMMLNPPAGNLKNIGHPFIPGKKAYGWRIDWRQVANGFNLDRW